MCTTARDGMFSVNGWPARSPKRFDSSCAQLKTEIGDGNGVTGDPCKIAVRGFDSLHLHQEYGSLAQLVRALVS